MMKTSRWFALSLLTLGGCFAGCDAVAPCGEGESYCQGLCLPLPSCPESGDGDGDDSMGGGAGAPGNSCEGMDDTGIEFGDACTDNVNHSDCGCPAPICAVEPGKDEGFCTQIHCDLSDATGSCPSGYTCTDFSAFQPDAPPICWPN